MALLVDSFSTRRHASVRAYQRRGRRNALLGFLALYGLTVAVAVGMLRGTPSPVIFAWMIYLAGLGTCLIRPRYGLYLIVGLTLPGDWLMWPAYPFTKNFSSVESWFFVHDNLIINPLETYLIATIAGWAGQDMAARRLRFRGGPIFAPLMAFTALVGIMLVYGIARGGGNPNVALWEVRPLAYLPLVFVLAANLLETRRHVNMLLWTLLIAIALRGLVGVVHVYTALGGSLEGHERIGSHPMSIFFDSIFVMVIGAFIFRESLWKRIWLLALLPPILFSFFANQRRASFLVLAIALLVIGVVLFSTRRRLFWRVAPLT
ncbi:MAG: O-antigen ligase domain-containing protein, partial [Chloroflexaceae bacterium]|nr:O-antigen ligase domain-containing protein [Chloroflexaceae bacterium]